MDPLESKSITQKKTKWFIKKILKTILDVLFTEALFVGGQYS